MKKTGSGLLSGENYHKRDRIYLKYKERHSNGNVSANKKFNKATVDINANNKNNDKNDKNI